MINKQQAPVIESHPNETGGRSSFYGRILSIGIADEVVDISEDLLSQKEKPHNRNKGDKENRQEESFPL